MSKTEQPLKILSIGNSFSQDAHRWLHALAQCQGLRVETVNLFIGGCSLQTHWDNASCDRAAYDLERNGGEKEDTVSIRQALTMADWDVVTFQQASPFSGLRETYEPYLSGLANLVRQECPDAKLYFHQTWAYETDFQFEGFAAYDNDQSKMFCMIQKASRQAAETIGASLLPVGEVIQWLRENTSEFDYKNGGRSLCRDGFHLTLDYGRVAAAATWMAVLTGHLPQGGFLDLDPALLERVYQAVSKVCKK